MGPAEPSCPFVRRSGRACFLLCLRDADSLRLSRKRRARRSWSGPGPNVVCEDVRLACPGESCVPNANGCRSRRFPNGAKGNYIYFHVQACPPLPEFLYMLTAVCDHGYVSDWASAMKSLPSEKIFWGSRKRRKPESIHGKVYDRGTREIEKGDARSVSFFIHTVRTVRVP